MIAVFDCIAYRVWLRIPLRWQDTHWSRWLLYYAGRHAYAEETEGGR